MCHPKYNILILVIWCVCVVLATSNIDNETKLELPPPLIQNHDVLKISNGSKTHTLQENLHSNVKKDANHTVTRIHLANWRWKEFGKILTPITVLILAGIFKLLFHHTPILSDYMPESCVLIIIGILMGAFVYAEEGEGVSEIEDIREYFPRFTSRVFFLVLLPPIILDAAYSIYDRQFLDNLGGVLVFAVIGTLFNAFLIGYGLYFINYLGFMGELPAEMDTIDCLKFAALISAVDPVAVLAIFQEIGVNISLYFMVFGESLLNDGVSVVLYNSMGSLKEIGEASSGSVDKINYVLAFFSFFTVVFGGLLIGLCIGLITSLIVKFTRHTQVIEPFLILAMSYVSYVMAETIHWSGIISLIGCGIAQKRYAFINISKKSLTTVKYSVKTLATVSDCIIFLFLGIVTSSNDNLQWHWGFSLWTCFLCLVIRFSGVFFLSAILNQRRLKKISMKEQIIIGYGGLRGAVGFSLAIILSQEDNGAIPKIFLTTTLFMVYFTVFIQGGTIKFLVEKLNIDKEEEKVKLISDDVNLKTIDLVMSGVGAVIGGISYSAALETLQSFDEKFIKKWLIRDDVLDSMTEKLNRISLEEHYARLYGPSVVAHQRKVNFVLKSLVPDKDVLSMSPSNIGMLHYTMGMLADDKVPPIPEQKIHRQESFNLTNVVMDKSILQRAFLDSAYERTKRAEYSRMSSTGSLKKYDDFNEQHEHVLLERNEKTKAIWQSAFSQISFELEGRKRSSGIPPQNKDCSNVVENETTSKVEKLNKVDDDAKRIKHAYKQAKDEFKVSRQGCLGHFNSEDDTQLQNNELQDDKQQLKVFNMQNGTGTSSSKTVTKL